jgi:hypothetical protein
MGRVRRRLLPLTIVPALVSALLLAGCTASRPQPPHPTEGPLRLASGRTTVVVAATSPAERAVEASRALFAASPGVVLAPEGDPSTQRAAAATAERLHVPMLLVPASSGSPSPSTGPAAAEAHRLGARWSVGPGLRIAGLRPRTAARTKPETAPT